jgi:hypothetical protein
MKRITAMVICALLWYGSMAYVLLELNPLLWKKEIRMDWLIFLFVFEIIVAAYPNYKK